MTGRAVRVWPASGATEAASAAKNTRIVPLVFILFSSFTPVSCGSQTNPGGTEQYCLTYLDRVGRKRESILRLSASHCVIPRAAEYQLGIVHADPKAIDAYCLRRRWTTLMGGRYRQVGLSAVTVVDPASTDDFRPGHLLKRKHKSGSLPRNESHQFGVGVGDSNPPERIRTGLEFLFACSALASSLGHSRTCHRSRAMFGWLLILKQSLRLPFRDDRSIYLRPRQTVRRGLG